MVLFTNHAKTFEINNYIKRFPDLYNVTIPQNWEENRVLTEKQLVKILEKGLVSQEDYTNTDNLWALTEILHYINPSLAIKLGVDIILFGGSVNFLGTEKHKPILDEILSGRKQGCFAMTEIAHGSNLKGLKTTAKKLANRIIINTPDDDAVKCWIGGATKANYATVFCQLYDEQNIHQGLHAVLVPLTLSGIERIDMGPKLGLNGIDNGYIRFNNVEVPVDNLLDKYGGFNSDGKYVSLISNKDIRFSKMLSALSVGRISIAIGAYAISYKAFIIALKYNLKRKQFVFKGEQDEKRIIEYNTQLSKFAFIYSNLYHMRLGILELIELYKNNGVDKRLHAMSSLMKVFNTWNAVEITNNCREMCGGHGYLWVNQLGLLINDVNIYQTFEGDNTVLIQQGVKWILEEYKNKKLKQFISNTSSEQYKLNLKIEHILYGLFNAQNKQKFWLDNLNIIVNIGKEYTNLYLVDLSKNQNETIWSKLFRKYIDNKNIDNYYLDYIIKEKIFEDIANDWDKIHSERTEFIPITKYPLYLQSLL